MQSAMLRDLLNYAVIKPAALQVSVQPQARSRLRLRPPPPPAPYAVIGHAYPRPQHSHDFFTPPTRTYFAAGRAPSVFDAGEASSALPSARHRARRLQFLGFSLVHWDWDGAGSRFVAGFSRDHENSSQALKNDRPDCASVGSAARHRRHPGRMACCLLCLDSHARTTSSPDRLRLFRRRKSPNG